MSTGQHWRWGSSTSRRREDWVWDETVEVVEEQAAQPQPEEPPSPPRRNAHVHVIAARNLVGTVLDGHIVLGGLLETDAFGDLYAAHSDAIKLDLAVRLLNPSVLTHAPGVANYMADIEATAALDSRHLSGVIASRMDGPQPFVARHHLRESTTLRVLQAGEPLPARAAFTLASRIANALAELHDLRVLHRNLTTRSIRVVGTRAALVENPTEAAHMPFQIVDWAQHLLVAARSPMVAHRKNPDRFFGFPETMSPEQVRAEPADVRSDVYALGCVLYEMLTGKAPFTSQDFAQTLQRHIYEKPLRPGIIRRDVQLGAEETEIVMMALAKRPEERFASLDAFATALEEAGHGRRRDVPFRPRQEAVEVGAHEEAVTPEVPSVQVAPAPPAPRRHLSASRSPSVAGMHCLRVQVGPARAEGHPTVHVAIDVANDEEVRAVVCDARGEGVAVHEDLVTIPHEGEAEIFFKLRGPTATSVELVLHDVDLDDPEHRLVIEGSFEVTDKARTAPWHPSTPAEPPVMGG